MNHPQNASVTERKSSSKLLMSRDYDALALQGKKPQLKRRFGFLSMLGFTTTMLISWEAIFFVNPIALEEAGPVGLLYGFIFCFIGTICTAVSMAELVSMAPTAGAQYHWVALLAPHKYKIFLSWLTGWLSVIGWQAFVASGAYLCATIIQGLAVLNYPDYVPKSWQGTLILYAVLMLCVFVNAVAARALPRIEGLILMVHILAFFGILIPLTYLAPKSSAKFVFTTFINLNGWPNNGVSWMIGLTSSVFPFLGYDGPCHMAEEVKDAPVIVPWCIVAGIAINGLMAFAMVLVFLFTLGDLESVLQSKTGYDFIQVFYNVTRSLHGATAMVSILIAMALCATFGLLASTSRMTWAFARDNGLPFSKFFAKIHQPAAVPLNAILISTLVSALLALINIGSSAAFNAIVSITIAGLSFSYFLPIALLAYRRSIGNGVRYGPWSMGRCGVLVNLAALVFLLITTIFSFFPTVIPVTLTNMNWSCVVFGAAVIFGCLYYAFFAQKVYTGPVMEIDVSDLGLEPYGT